MKIKITTFLGIILAVIAGFFALADGARAATNSNTFYSQVKDTGQAVDFTTITWTDYVPADTTVVVSARAGNTATPDASWANYDWSASFAKSGALDILDGNQYVQYSVVFTYTDTSLTPNLQDITLNYYQYYIGTYSLISSKYDTSSGDNVIGSLAWDEDASLPSGTTVMVSLRASSTATLLDTTEWTDFTNATANCSKPEASQTVTCSISAIPDAMKDGVGDQWVQYKIALTSTTGANTATVDNINITYMANDSPEVQTVTASQTLGTGLVPISFAARDTDTVNPANVIPGYVDATVEYCTSDSDPCASWSQAEIGALDWGGVGTNSTGNARRIPITADYQTFNVAWNPSADSGANNNYYAAAQIRITVDDKERINNQAAAISSAFALDTADPILGSPAVSVRATTTPANLVLSATDNSGLQYKLSLNSDLAGADWQDYSASQTITLATDPDTVYAQFKDAYGNTTSIQSATTPETPSNMIFRDLSSPDTSTYQEFISWKVVANPDPGFAKYNVWRSTDGVDYSISATISSRATNYLFDTLLDSAATYRYKITAEDDNGNVSYFSSIVSDLPDGQGGTDTTPPTISSVSAVTTTQSAIITWTTDELSNSTVGYSATPGVFTDEIGVASYVTSHSVILTNLAPATTYYYRITSADPFTNETIANNGGDGYEFTTLAGPAISAVSSPDIKNTEATITWITDIASDSHVYYSTSATLANATHISRDESAAVANHSVPLTGLTSGTRYYFYVTSGVATADNGGDYYNFSTTVDTTAPTIVFDPATGITGITDSSATVSWTTNESATSTLEYGLDTSYASGTLANDNFNTDHSFNLSGLTLGSTYYLRLKSADANGNTRTSANHTFETTDSTDIISPTITSVSANPVYDTVAVIKWTTNEAANSLVEYGATSGTYTASSSGATLTTGHALTLSGLTASTIYYYRVTSADGSANTASSTEANFTTMETLSTETQVKAREAIAQSTGEVTGRASVSGGGVFASKTDKQPPTISNVQAANIKSDQATISWKTDEESNSFVEYGNNNSYGFVDGNWNQNISHSVTIKRLIPSSAYYFRAVSVDSAGNLGRGSGQTFTTLSVAEEASGKVGEGAEEGSGAGTGATPETAAQATATENLVTDTAKKAIDIIGQYAGQVSLSLLESTLFSQYDSLENIAKIIPAPVITSGPRVSVSPSTATISWGTDKESNSLIAFAPEEMYAIAGNRDNPYVQLIGNPDAKDTDHNITLYDLRPDTIYHYQLRSKPPIGPLVRSGDFTFRTEKEALEIISHAIENVSTEKAVFRWITNLPADSSIKYTPYRNNTLAVDETKSEEDKSLVTIHEVAVADFESGVTYQIELSGKDIKGALVSRAIPTFTTSADDLPPLVYQVQAESAISPGKETKIQTIISWLTNEPATSRVYFQQGFAGPDTDQLAEKTALDTGYAKKHIVVITKFNPGSIYTFRVESTDSGGNTTISKTYTLLAPRQKETVFQIIMKNLEQTFSWVNEMGW